MQDLVFICEPRKIYFPEMVNVGQSQKNVQASFPVRLSVFLD
jgi:hypothetical protein